MFLKQLKDICNELCNIQYVNNGGCGFVANELAKKLTPILGKENVRIRYIREDSHHKTLHRIKKDANINSISKSFLYNIKPYKMYSTNSHLVCTIKYKNNWYVLEAGGFYKTLKQYPDNLSKDSFTIEELDNFLYYRKFWNSTYNRNNNKKIKNIINKGNFCV